MTIHGLLLCDDLMFASRVTGTAHDLERKVRMVRDPATLLQHFDEQHPKAVILDLNQANLEIVELVAALKSRNPTPFIVGFGSHVDSATLKKAQEAGCDIVLPRSAFVQRLPSELLGWLDGPSVSTSPS